MAKFLWKLLCICSVSSSVYALDVPNTDPCSLTYQAKGFKPIDPQGDFCMAELGLRVGTQVLNIIFNHQTLSTSSNNFEMNGVAKQGGPKSSTQGVPWNSQEAIDNSILQIEGTIVPVRPLNLVEMFGQVMLEENRANGFQTQYGTVHRWSDEFIQKKDVKKRYHALGPFYGSKILMALAMGAGKKFIPSGKEDDLEIWILNQPDHSVTLENIFRQSYVLNEGNVYLSVLTISNYLSFHWRDPNRANLPFVKKLTSITNRWQERGDTFGSWYHLFGIMLYGFVKGESRAKLVARTESLMSYWGGDGDIEEQEDFINLQGAIAGGRLAKLVTVWDFLSWPDQPSRLNPSFYLNLTEDFRDRIKYNPDQRFSVTKPKIVQYPQEPGDDAIYEISVKSIDPNINQAICNIEIIPKFSHKKRFFAQDLIRLPSKIIKHAMETSLQFSASPNMQAVRTFIQCGDGQ